MPHLQKKQFATTRPSQAEMFLPQQKSIPPIPSGNVGTTQQQQQQINQSEMVKLIEQMKPQDLPKLIKIFEEQKHLIEPVNFNILKSYKQ